MQRTNNGVVYFDSLQQVADPSIASLTSSQNLNRRSTLKAIADSTGRLIAVNPAPGTIGTLSPTYLQGPGYFRFDVNLIKKIQIRESKELIVRADAINVLNHEAFDNPNTNINSTNFGRITKTSDVSNPRIIALSLRLNF